MKKKLLLGLLVASMAMTTGCGWLPFFVTTNSSPRDEEQTTVVAEPEEEEQQEEATVAEFDNPFAEYEEAPLLPDIDISDCDTFTQIVDKLEPGMAYTNVTIGDADVLLVTNYTKQDSKGNNLANGAILYVYEDGVPTEIQQVVNGGYPLAVDQGILYFGAEKEMESFTIQDNTFVHVKSAWEDTNLAGETGYFFYEGEEPTVQEDDDSTLQAMQEQYRAMQPLTFDVIQ